MDGSCLGPYRGVLGSPAVCGMATRRIRLSVKVVLYNIWPFAHLVGGRQAAKDPLQRNVPVTSVIVDCHRLEQDHVSEAY